MIKNLFVPAAMMLAVAGLTACTSDGPEGPEAPTTSKIEVSAESISMPQDGGESTLTFTAPGKWSINNPNSWMTLSYKNTGDPKGTVTITVGANSDDKERTGSFTISSGNVSKQIRVKQYGPIDVESNYLSISGSGAEKSVAVNTEGEWTATSTADWVNITEAKGNKLVFSVGANDTDKERDATIELKGEYSSGKIAIHQRLAGDDDEIVAPKGYALVWHDEFNSGKELGSDWRHEVQGPGWVNHELQTYVNGKSPSGRRVTEIDEGVLRINCFKENNRVYSGRVYAKPSQGWKYGYIEASIRLPKGRGTWPAFWMMPVNFRSWPADGEIDIMEEVGYHPNYVSSSLHANAHVHSNGTQVTKEVYCPGAEGEFHTYAIEWTPDYITTFVDGKLLLHYDNRGLGRDDWPYDAPFYVILNLAWGGDWGGAQGVDESKLPVSMEVDYVRVFQKP